MAVKLRLMRMGKKKQPTYRSWPPTARSPRNGRFIEIVGTYEPRQEPSVMKHRQREGRRTGCATAPSRPSGCEKLLKISGSVGPSSRKPAPSRPRALVDATAPKSRRTSTTTRST